LSNTTYSDKVGPPVNAGWLNDINFVVYNLLGNGTSVPATRSELLANIGAGVVGGGNVNYQQESAPPTPNIGDLWEKPSTGVMSRWNGAGWIVFGDIAQGVAAAAQTTANTAIVNAASAAAAAAAASSAAAAAQASATSAINQLANIASDNVLSQGEKPQVITDYSVLIDEQAGIDAQASAYAITTQKANYDFAISTLVNYLAGQTSPVLWSDLSNITTIVGTDFRNAFSVAYLNRQALLNEIARVAGTVATWAGVSGIDVTTTQIHASAVTDIYFNTNVGPVTITGLAHTPDGFFFNTLLTSVTFTANSTGYAQVFVEGVTSYLNSSGSLTATANWSIQDAGQAYDVTHVLGYNIPPSQTALFGMTTSRIFSVTAGNSYTFGFYAHKLNSGDTVTTSNIEMRVDVIKR